MDKRLNESCIHGRFVETCSGGLIRIDNIHEFQVGTKTDNEQLVMNVVAYAEVERCGQMDYRQIAEYDVGEHAKKLYDFYPNVRCITSMALREKAASELMEEVRKEVFRFAELIDERRDKKWDGAGSENLPEKSE